MSRDPALSSLRSRSVFVSDVHLGFDGCSAQALLAFLEKLQTQTLYLVGDVLDLSCASSSLSWPQAHHAVIRAILAIAERGTRVVYVPGNHDALLRDLDGARFGGVEIRREALHETADGRRFLVVHGDEFDAGGLSRPWLEALGGRAYGALLGLERQLNTLAVPLGLPPVCIAGSLKQAIKSSQRASFERAVIAEATRRGVDGVICGHLHRAEILDLGGVLYCNDGDWVESCTALAEDFQGRLALLQWPARQSEAAAAVLEGPLEVAAA